MAVVDDAVEREKEWRTKAEAALLTVETDTNVFSRIFFL